MLIKSVKKLSPLERLLYWIEERESVRVKKESNKPKPWTDDTILQQFKFTNIRRMDDRVSVWFYENWYKPYKDHPNMLLAATLARQFNNPDAMESIGFPHKWDKHKVADRLMKRQEEGLTNFSGAYMITGTLGGPKVHQVVYKVADPIYKAEFIINPKSMEDNWQRLLKFAGFSSFIAGQVVADLRWAVTGTWSDRYTWAPQGPGSQRGLNRVLGRPISTKFKQGEFCLELRKLRDVISRRLPAIASKLELHDIQSTCCETDKYSRALLNEGRPKQRYPGVE